MLFKPPAIHRRGLDIANNLEDPAFTSNIRVFFEVGRIGHYLTLFSDGVNWHIDSEASISIVYGSKLIDFIRDT
ncbi:hypothetical protein BWD42_04130 [Sphingobacterium sp. CZ-UAM]|nr:hypothetical protein BWD42_04130 [Sphingobacterium sp. CZ-UAM]